MAVGRVGPDLGQTEGVTDPHHRSGPVGEASDGFAGFRDRFYLPAPPANVSDEIAYLCGHSLGLQPKAVADELRFNLDRWAEMGVEGHFGERGWYQYAERMIPHGAALVGAQENEVAFCNTLTANLHFLMASFYRPAGGRNQILIEAGAFPSDRYAVATQAQWHGLDPAEVVVEVQPEPGRATIGTDAVVSAIEAAGEQLALVLFSGVQFATGERFDLAAITEAAHRVGAIAGFDLAHAAGNVELNLHDADADFAAWCNYKYCNSGPGAVGAIFVNARHGTDRDRLRLAGWWGNDPDTRFDMDTEHLFVPRPDANSWAVSNPPIMALAPIAASLPLFTEVGMAALAERSRTLTGALERTLLDSLGERIEILTPAEPEQRGSQLSVRLDAAQLGPDGGKGLEHRLATVGVVVDFRPPDIIRLAPTAMYNNVDDIDRAVTELARALG